MITAFIRKAVSRLSAALFDYNEDTDEGFSPQGEKRAAAFLSEFDEAAFNAGWDALATEMVTRDVFPKSTKLTHPQWIKDRRTAYRKRVATAE